MLTKELLQIIDLHTESEKMFNVMKARNNIIQKSFLKMFPDDKYLQGKIYKLSVDGYREGDYIGSTIKSLNLSKVFKG